LSGLVTTLATAAKAGELTLAVRAGSGWPKGKRVLVCEQTRCEDARLSRDGRTAQLGLATPLKGTFPAGSIVYVSNTVRYYLRPDGRGFFQVMRQVDGGVSSLIGNVSRFRLSYLAADGRPTTEARRVSRIAVDLTVGRDNEAVTSLVGIPTRRTA
jgi:hypothetical protein